jgi:hypothetical protein
LGARPSGIDKVDVVDFKVGCPGSQSGGHIIVRRVILALALSDGNSVRREAAGIGCFSVESQGRLERRDVDLLFVGTWSMRSVQ